MLKRAVADIEPVPGAGDTLGASSDRGDTARAIATGGWRGSPHFKLGRVGLEVVVIPFACSDDAVGGRDIIRFAVERTAEGGACRDFEDGASGGGLSGISGRCGSSGALH